MRTQATFAAIALLGLVSSSPSAAQPFDHLQCFKIKDPHSFAAFAEFVPLQAQSFPTDGCKIRVRSKELCIAAEKNLLSSTAPALSIVGQDLTNDFICYRASCTNSLLPLSLNVADQFGERKLAKFKRSKRICTPAVRVPLTTTTLSTTTTSTTTTTVP